MTGNTDKTVNAQLVTEGLVRVAKQISTDVLVSGMVEETLVGSTDYCPGSSRKTRSRMWRDGDVG
jgi:hypothetical protein